MLHIGNVVPSLEILQKINKIDAFKYAWLNQMSQNKVLKNVHYAGIYDVIKPEYEVITPKTDNKMMENLWTDPSSNFQGYKEHKNYIRLLRCIFDNYKSLALSETLILRMHKLLFNNIIEKCGKYKNKQNSILVYNVDSGVTYRLFEPASPQDTPQLMQELIAWTNENLHKGIYHPIIVIALFADYFLAIHPFREGNGRMMRALIMLLMMQAGYIYMPYSSLEAIIKASKSAYYRSLWLTHQTIWSDKPNYEPWLAFFVKLLEKQKLLLEEKISPLLHSL